MLNKSKVLITGYTGFVGSRLLDNISDNYDCVLLGRQKTKGFKWEFADFSLQENYFKALNVVDVVIHCAARVHLMDDDTSNPQDLYKYFNTDATLKLAKQASESGVNRFIFISSIKVNGESTEHGRPFKPDYNHIPADPYGLSKYEAEIGLHKIAKETGMEIVIIRPPLVYGPGVKANFSAMMKWVNRGIPLPLGGIKQNKRSLVSVDNLVDLIVTCIEHPNAANQTFLVSDDEDVSTTGLLKSMAAVLNVPSRLAPIPGSWIDFVSKLIGKPAISQRLCGSLQVDISKTKDLLSWKPPYSPAEAMKKTADAFVDNLNKKK